MARTRDAGVRPPIGSPGPPVDEATAANDSAAAFDYSLPPELVAQSPTPRGAARLLVVPRDGGPFRHQSVADFTSHLDRDDLLLLNDTRVLAARLEARRASGRRFEVLLLEPLASGCWEALLRPSARARVGECLTLADGGQITLAERLGDGRWRLTFADPVSEERLEAIGAPPLPPYISRPDGPTAEDRAAYQTVFARAPGAVAAPTAGLHFTAAMLADIAARGVEPHFVTLHVGIGTFRPVTAVRLADHRMHSERYCFTDDTAAAVNRAMSEHRRIVCVGTTSVRALEGALAAGAGRVAPGWATTDIFITPGYRLRGVGALLTNFHLPRSTLLMLVSALAGRERVLAAYAEAVGERYRFFSFGDAMLVE